MRHDLILEGPAYRLRPIEDGDASFVLELRGNSALNRYLHVGSQSLSDQLSWFARYYERTGDYYFVVERKQSGRAEGVISIYDINPNDKYGEWGRWIIKPDSLAAVESAWLIYSCAFEKLGLERVYCRTVANNSSVVSFHDSCGIVSRSYLPNHFDLEGKLVDAIEHQVDRKDWAEIGPRLATLAKLMARRLCRD